MSHDYNCIRRANSDEESGDDSSKGKCKPMHALYYFGAICLSGLWAGAMGAGALALAAAPFGIFFSFYSASLAVTLSDADSVNQMQNEMRGHVNQLGRENDALAGENDRLEGEVDRVAEIDAKLKGIAEAQGTNVAKLVELVAKNHEYLKRMRQITKAETAQALVEMVIESDKDGDFMLDEDETELLILKMNNFRTYIKVNAKNFKAELKKGGGSLKGVMNIVKTIVADDDATKDLPDEEKIFIIDEHLGQRDVGKKKKKK